ncbi:CPBP family intramembrane glutamic endopeptidase [Acetivibrio mesophilus]|uniref:CPBP family intramembrane metalloprotease n=1 Tax=Acetivibrio mesophilus TaxID=2487273 RepID=A0A4Q0I3T5_9FIRM|nr:type II CAAX endopeptidase family protein [Acetivibrio mesophilus]ODM26660.1 abortive infection protein [Clostridium sp. Bc-iso-3]RXE58908.1 CPBP family intramembrane metalloprotease [Acetivibrio mesophilus]HHV28458.1 CPBP family intramembrane metalloprotease [Clostridium sp.]
MVDSKQKSYIIKALIPYLIAFYLFWAVYSIFIEPIIEKGPYLINLVGGNLIKLGAWTVPVLVLLKYLFKEDPWDYIKLRKNKLRGLVYGSLYGVVIIIYVTVSRLLTNGTLQFNPFFELDSWIGGVLLVGFTEEIVFRGFLLQKFEEAMGSKYANAVTALLFLLIHFPKWYVNGNLFIPGFMVNSIAFIFLFSILMAVLLKKTDSLLTCILIHSANNFAMFALGA